MAKTLLIILVALGIAGCSNKSDLKRAADFAAQNPEVQDEEIPTDPQALFLYENAQNNPDIIVRPSGLQIRVIKRGTGEIPTARSMVTAHYHGTLIDGTVFDTTRNDGQPFTFPMEGVIEGWQEALMLMQEGAIYQIFIPSSLGYGQAGAGTTIPPGATLIFEVELVAVQFPLSQTRQSNNQ